MADEFPAGSSSCVRCRIALPPECVICSCAPVAPDLKPAPSMTGPIESPFVLAMAIGIMIAFFLFYDPVRLKEERGKPMPLKSSVLAPDLERWKAYGDELRRRYVDAYGGGGKPVTLEHLRSIVEDRLKEVDRDPSFTREQRAEIRRIINVALTDRAFK